MHHKLTNEHKLSIIRNGLGKTSTPKKIVIIGAGMAGLVAASLLKEAGHEIVVLEASARVGGRIFTIRDPFSPELYFEAGAMRIPTSHVLVGEFIKKFKLSTQPFINSTPNDFIYVNGIKTRRWYYEKKPDILNYPVAPQERGKTAEDLILTDILPILSKINLLSITNNWAFTYELEKFTFDTFLLRNPFGNPLSPGAVQMIKELLNFQGLSGLSALNLIRTFIPFFDPRVSFYKIKDGNDRLPMMFYSTLKNNISFHQKVIKIVFQDHKVVIHSNHTDKPEGNVVSGDYAIITIPFSTLRLVEIEPHWAFSYYKWKAIFGLHYSPATKIGLEFKSRFWEKEGIHGGHMVTDLSSKETYYPSQHIGSDRPSVILASYTFGDDTLVWDSQPESERLKYVLRNLAAVHGDVVYDEYVKGVSVSWRNNPFIAGGFSTLLPEQETQLIPHILTPEGRVHFAGEHTSSYYRAWIEGAVESGIRASYEVNLAIQQE